MEERRTRRAFLPTVVVAICLWPAAASAQHEHAVHGHETTSGALAAGDRSPTEAGQAAFAAIAEIVSILENDPATDWSRVDIGALRDHLVDMQRLVCDTRVSETPVEGGLEIVVGGPEEAVAAARRMVPAHAAMIAATHPWTVSVEDRGNELTVHWTTTDAREVPKLRALGFYGLMVEGSHHQRHHLMIARGLDPHHSES